MDQSTGLEEMQRQFMNRLHVNPKLLANSVTYAMTGHTIPPVPRRNAGDIMQQINADLAEHGISVKQ